MTGRRMTDVPLSSVAVTAKEEHMGSARGLLVVLVVLVLVALSGPLMMGGMMGPGHMGPAVVFDGGWRGGMMWGLGGLTMLAFWGALIVATVFLVRHLDTSTSAADRPRPESPLEIVDRRYAAGELTREQFEQMRKDLQKD